MTPEKLKEIEERRSKAIAGPYVDTLPPSNGFLYVGPAYVRGMVWMPYEEVPTNPDFRKEVRIATQAFLAHSWQDVGDLTQEIRELESLWIEERAIRIYDIESTAHGRDWSELSESAQRSYREKAQHDYRLVRGWPRVQP